jgi:FemAB-related protein (PEP-CTERM system-associated)
VTSDALASGTAPPRASVAAPVSVREMETGDAERWDAFVLRSPDATFFHRAGWKRVVENAFGHKAPYLVAERGGEIAGVLPLVHIRSRLFGNALVSNGFCVYGGPVGEDEAVLEALDAEAATLMDRLGTDHLEYRLRRRFRPDRPCKEGLYFTFRRALEADPEKNLKAIPRKQRAVVRQSLERNLVIEEDATSDRLWRIYAQSVHGLGTPVFGAALFRELKREFGNDCRIVTVLHEGAPVTSCLSFYFRDEVLPYYAGGTPAARDTGAYDFMYWHILSQAAAEGRRVFDFGRSKAGTGAFSFKKNWGFKPEPIFHEFRLKPGKEIPDNNPLNPKYRLFIAAWKHLPLAVANLLGPMIAKDLG